MTLIRPAVFQQAQPKSLTSWVEGASVTITYADTTLTLYHEVQLGAGLCPTGQHRLTIVDNAGMTRGQASEYHFRKDRDYDLMIANGVIAAIRLMDEMGAPDL